MSILDLGEDDDKDIRGKAYLYIKVQKIEIKVKKLALEKRRRHFFHWGKRKGRFKTDKYEG